METKLTPTQGEFAVYSLGGELSIRHTQSLEEICVVKNKNSIHEMESNAQILSNGLDTYNKCHLLPSQLLQQRDELMEAIKEFCIRVEKGEVRSKNTYEKFKSLIQKQQI